MTVLALALGAGAGYTVRPGDTLWDIARHHGVSVTALAKSNGIANPDYILPGQVLEIPGSGGGSGSTGTAAVMHDVRAGETLSGIASRYGVSVRRVAGANNVGRGYVIYAGRQLRIPGATAVRTAIARTPATSRSEIESILIGTAQEYGFNPAFVKAIAYQESGWNNQVVSSAGAKGVMQVMPETGEWVGRYLLGRSVDLDDPHDNVRAGVAFLDYLWDVTGGDPEMTLAGYYQGLRSVEENGKYSDTKSYVRNVLALRDRFV
ncbi:MAG: lytic transglycosylase domain-containing protein [Egibacteraceae bacterium]